MTQQISERGFSLIELMVSLGVFAIVITISVGSLLALVAQSQKTQASQNTMTNVAFAIDSVTREIRTGYDYVCDRFNNTGVANAFDDQEALTDLDDCANGYTGEDEKNTGVSFKEGGESITGSSAQRIAFWFDLRESQRTLYRRVGNGAAERILSDNVEVIDGEFIVNGTTQGDGRQPTVTMYLEARDVTNPDAQPMVLQTTITQRILDL